MGKDNNKFKNELSVHHIIGRMNRSWADVERDTNKMILGVLKHNALNTLMGDSQEPQLQLEVMYEKFRKPVLSDYVCQQIEEVLSLPKDKFYRKELIRPGKSKKK